MKINVTKEDIKKGKPKEARLCPIARACKRAGLKDAAVRYTRIENGRQCFPISKTTSRFISDFDLGKPVKPFSFYLRA